MKTKSLHLRELVYIHHTRNAGPVTVKDGRRFGPGELFLQSFDWQRIFEKGDQLFDVNCIAVKAREFHENIVAVVTWPDEMEITLAPNDQAQG